MNEALRYNEGKCELGRLRQFGEALEAVAEVMAQGAIKYDDRNWLTGGKPDAEYLDSADRHLLKWANEGEWYDSETGCAHVAHAAWNLLALLKLNYSDMPRRDPGFDQPGFLDWWGPADEADAEADADYEDEAVEWVQLNAATHVVVDGMYMVADVRHAADGCMVRVVDEAGRIMATGEPLWSIVWNEGLSSESWAVARSGTLVA